MHLLFSLICTFFFLTTSLAVAGPPNPTPSDVSDNTAGGRDALIDTTEDGIRNTAFGSFAMRINTTGDRNTAFGAGALYSTNGQNNTAVGFLSLGEVGSGSDNTAVGQYALENLHIGNKNVAVGSGAGLHLEHGYSNIYLVHPGFPKENYTIRIGYGQTRTFIAGIANRPLNGAPVVVMPNGQLGVSPNASTLEQRINTLERQVQALMRQIQAAH